MTHYTITIEIDAPPRWDIPMARNSVKAAMDHLYPGMRVRVKSVRTRKPPSGPAMIRKMLKKAEEQRWPSKDIAMLRESLERAERDTAPPPTDGFKRKRVAREEAA